MQSLPFAFTAAPNVDNFTSPYEEGYGQGYSQMSDSVKRLQAKRELNQQDVRLNQNERQMNIDVWKTQVQSSLEQAKMAQSERLGAKDFALRAQAQAFDIQTAAREMPLKYQAQEMNNRKTGLEIQTMQRDLSSADSSTKMMSQFVKAMTTLPQNQEDIVKPLQSSNRKEPNRAVDRSQAQANLSAFAKPPTQSFSFDEPSDQFTA